MYHRLINLTNSNSFFLLGPRGSGKSTLLLHHFKDKDTFWVDLLDPEQEAEYQMYPMRLIEKWLARSPRPEWIVIDEVQKAPKLLDVVHLGIEKHDIKFALTGSSARKLKYGASNLLAGRAFVFHLHPLTSFELKNDFDLNSALQWGTLPGVMKLPAELDKKRFLKAYSQTYLKEEIQLEQLVRKIEPFRKFLEVAAQSNGEILNYSRLAREAGIDSKSVERYFELLNDTLIGFYLEAYEPSVRKRQQKKPKFYLFDPGVCRALQNLLDVSPSPRTYGYGKSFEHYVILECMRLNDYYEKNFRFSYLRTKDGAEIDLIVERPGDKPILAEIKSASSIDPSEIRKLKNMQKGFENSESMILCNAPEARVSEGVLICPWQEGIRRIFSV